MQPNTQAFDVQEKLANLEQMLVNNTPNIAELLRIIHRQLHSDPALCTLLSEEEISILVRGLKKQTNTVMATKANAKPKKAMSKMQVGLDL
tara:strand:+ start:138 stop:410 length:273 start_codon:yes stop_codon:yes gene_type:complete